MLHVLLLAALAAGPAPPHAGRGAGTVPLWNPHKAAPGNPPLTVRVLVLNYDPLVPGEGHRRLSEVFKWGNPARMATRYKEAMEHASGGYLRFDIVEWRNLNEIYHQEDGKTYTVVEYVKNRRAGKGWRTGRGGMADYPRIIREQNVEPLIDDGRVDEVWIFSDHYFGLWEASMAGPGAFFINGGVYPRVPTRRPFAFYGFNYERGVAEMMHNAAHRVEATMNRAYGGWNLKDPKNNWEKFSANHDQSGGLAGVGTCHWPPNAKGDYDYGNTREVSSWADAFLTYPKLDLKRKTVSRATWSKGPDHHLDYMKWYFGHLPRAAGVNDDKRQNNWYKYVFDFQGYDAKGQPLPPSAEMLSGDIADPKAGKHVLRVAYKSAEQIDPSGLRDGNLSVTGPDGKALAVKLVDDGGLGGRSWRVARYEVPGPFGEGVHAVTLRAEQVRTLDGKALPAAKVGVFRVSRAGAGAEPLAADADTTLLARFDGDPDSGKVKGFGMGLAYEEGLVGKGLACLAGVRLSYPVKGVLAPKAGSVEMWVKPTGPGDSGKGRALLHAGTAFNNALHLVIDGANNLRLMTWDAKGKESGVGVSAAKWKAGEWHHVAATWEGRKLALYVDGVEAAATAEGVELTGFSTGGLWVGSRPRGEDAIEAVIDELRISRRARTAAEIRASASVVGIPSLQITAPAAMLLGGRAVARAEGVRELTRAVAWSSSDPAVVSADERGDLRAGKAGTAKLTARLGKLEETVTVKVVDPGLPTAKLSAPIEAAKVGGGAITFRVTYASKAGFRKDAVQLGSVRVTGPGGYNGFPEVVKVADGVAVYRLAPPAEKWADADVGAYTIEAKAFHVTDMAGHSVPESILGRLEVKK